MYAVLSKTTKLILFLVLVIGMLFSKCNYFISPEIISKWYIFYISGGLLLIVYCINEIFRYNHVNNSIKHYIFLLVIVVTIEGLLGLSQYINIHKLVNQRFVSGTFDNPAGLASSLCIVFPFCLLYLNEKRWAFYYSLVCATIIGISILVSASRSGIIVTLIVIFLYVLHSIRIGNKAKILILIFFMAISLGLYFSKKDSANGRLLIWKCSWEMIKDKPIKGFGPNGFQAHYMNYQAEYFKKHPNSKYMLLGGNTLHPFNEFILLTVNYGVLALILILILVIFIRKLYNKNSRISYISYLSLISIGIFSLFSYPFSYPFTWFMVILNLYFIIKEGDIKFKYLWVLKKGTSVILLTFSSLFLIFTFERMQVDKKWKEVTFLKDQEEKIKDFALLYPHLKKNPIFLYNYAAELNYYGDYETSLKIAKECEQIFADFDLQLLLGDNYLELQNYIEAEKHYYEASKMFPVKFGPLYDLYNLYVKIGEDHKAYDIAEDILKKPIKIISPEIVTMKYEMKKAIQLLENKYIENKI